LDVLVFLAGVGALAAAWCGSPPLRARDAVAAARITALRHDAPGVELEISPAPGNSPTLDVFHSPALGPQASWRLAADRLQPTAWPHTWRDPTPPVNMGFYTIGDSQQDTDGDTLADARERLLYGTDPHAADSDVDGIDDGWELHFAPALDPTVADGDADPDGDGIDNRTEYDHHTCPTSADTNRPRLSLVAPRPGRGVRRLP
jgi:hypothetical protein